MICLVCTDDSVCLLRLSRIPASFCRLANEDTQFFAHGATEMGFLGVCYMASNSHTELMIPPKPCNKRPFILAK